MTPPQNSVPASLPTNVPDREEAHDTKTSAAESAAHHDHIPTKDDRSSKPAPAPWRRLRAWAPWLVAAAILVYILVHTPLQELSAALSTVSLWRIGMLMAALVTSVVLIDALALWLGLRATMTGVHTLPYRAVLLVRGASSLPALLSYGAGQGSVVYFLYRRHRIPLEAGAGAVVLASVAFLVNLALVLGIGLLAGAVPDRPELRAVAWCALAVLPVYTLVLALRPSFLTNHRFLRPLFGAGVKAVIRIVGVRALHLFVLIAGNWLAMQLFDVDVPLATALIRLPVMFLIASLPISPSGLGTAQAAAITLFAPFAVGTDQAAPHAVVLAYSLSVHSITIAFLLGIGLLCLRRLQLT